MAIDVVMPRLGWTMEEGTLVEWLKASGDPVQVGDILFTVESDKALNEIEAFDSGTLHIPENAPAPGATVPVGTVLAYVLAAGEVGPALVPPPPERATAQGSAGPSAPAAAAISTDAGGNKPSISPRARRLAKDLGVDWERLTGTGSTGRVTEEDVRAAAASVGDIDPSVERVPMNPTRLAIATRLVGSHRDSAPVTLTAEYDVTALVELRSASRPRPAYNDFLIRFAAVALERHPALNSSLQGHDILLHESIHIGFAVDTEAGLLVPVVRDANRKSIAEIARDSARLGGQALRGELAGDDMRGGTFTITNLGAAGIDAFTPIINPPQCAILGIGRISQRPAVYEGQVVPRWLTVVSLSFDHRIIDGGPAARFLATLRQLVESPDPS
ncbi:MAG: dihydrolipoamide acetyltransferase family protein [bacterium]|nr:dihydrolipoamide acetyltransferase family protein [bacterium]